MRVKFARDFDFSPAAKNGHVTIAYKAGAEENVTRECVKAGAAANAIERSAEVDKFLAEDAKEADPTPEVDDGGRDRRG